MVAEHLISIQGPLTACGACGALGTLMQRGVRFKDDSCFVIRLKALLFFNIKLLGKKKSYFKMFIFFQNVSIKTDSSPTNACSTGCFIIAIVYCTLGLNLKNLVPCQNHRWLFGRCRFKGGRGHFFGLWNDKQICAVPPGLVISGSSKV